MAFRDDLVDVARKCNRILLILDVLAITEVLVDSTGRDLDADTKVTLTNAQRNAIQDKAIALRAEIKSITAAWP